MIDTHCHLWDRKYERENVSDIVRRAQAAGVQKMLCLGCHHESSGKSVEMAERFKGVVYAAVGTHPSDVREFSDDTLVYYRDLIGDHLDVVKSVGEIGLDYHYPNINKEQQALAFREQIGLARSVSLPVVVHCRDKVGGQDAYLDALSILDDSGISQVVYHCFSGTLGYSRQLLERGFFLSFTGVITYPSAAGADLPPPAGRRGTFSLAGGRLVKQSLLEVVKECPLERMMIETDSPYLAPQVIRGERNEPQYVSEVAKMIAGVKGISVEEVEEVTDRNAVEFFGL